MLKARLAKLNQKLITPDLSPQPTLEYAKFPHIIFSGIIEGKHMIELVLQGLKTATRRTWLRSQSDAALAGIGKCFKIKRAPQSLPEGWVRLIKCFYSTLDELTQDDLEKEGYGHLTIDEFCGLSFFKGLSRQRPILVLEFELAKATYP